MFKFNGIDLEQFVKVFSISTNVFDKINTFTDIPSRNGRVLQDSKYDYKQIDIGYDIKASTEEDLQDAIDTI